MFNRKAYKEIAKKQLKNRWSTPVLATLLIYGIFILTNIPQVIVSIITGNFPFSDFSQIFDGASFINEPGNYQFYYESVESPKFFSSNIISFAIEFFIYGTILMALTSLFVKMFHTTEKLSFKEFIEGFSKCISGFLGILWYSLWTTLWTLVFIIPGIVKAYSYSQMFFVMAENPKISCTKAMKISKILTKGNKGELFVMHLSFLLWDILNALTCGILGLWLIPYKTMSFTNAYYSMKSQALKLGSLSPEDFGEPSSDSIGEDFGGN